MVVVPFASLLLRLVWFAFAFELYMVVPMVVRLCFTYVRLSMYCAITYMSFDGACYSLSNPLLHPSFVLC
jgi:hypothetical protein